MTAILSLTDMLANVGIASICQTESTKRWKSEVASRAVLVLYGRGRGDNASERINKRGWYHASLL
jgi:hypothetical protein